MISLERYSKLLLALFKRHKGKLMSAKLFFSLIVLFVSLALSNKSYAGASSIEEGQKNINEIIKEEIFDAYDFAGFAQFYNDTSAYIMSSAGIKPLKDAVENVSIGQSLVIIGRHKLAIFDNINGFVSFKDQTIIWHSVHHLQTRFETRNLDFTILSKTALRSMDKKFQELRYVEFWEPLRLTSITIEYLLLFLNSQHGFGWGVSIILLSLILKIFILPANIWLARSQERKNNIELQLRAELALIKQTSSGRIAHERYMAAHKMAGVTTFYSLKPLFFTLLPLPILISVFNVLGQLGALNNQSFLWISDLSHPDAVYNFNGSMPFFGHSINLLPFIMTGLSIIAANPKKDVGQNAKQNRNQRLGFYSMSIGFFILFYPFPSAMLLYWTCANIWYLLQQRFIKI